MDWILLIVSQFSTFSIVIPSLNECLELGALNQVYWLESGQIAKAVCMKSFEV